jgi:enamine deaminase RidA (YjgF/YER057c/UK114 family)
MRKTLINPPGLYKHPAFTRVTTLEGPFKLVLVAGQTATDENYKCVAPGNLKAQWVRVMQNLEIQLGAVGATWEDVVYRRTFTLDVDEYLKIARDPGVPRFWNPDALPGSTLIGVTRLSDPAFLIEVDLMAAVAP